MTATVRMVTVTTSSACDADLRTRIGKRPHGQLWERVAEGRTVNYDVYPWGCLNAVEGAPGESERGRPVCIGAARYTGPVLGRHVCGDHHSHGIIRAGERVR